MPAPKKKSYTEYLPTDVIAAILALGLKGFHHAAAVQMVAAIIRLQERESQSLDDYKTIASTYWEKISQNYSPAMKALRGAGIVEVYTNEKGYQFSRAAKQPKAYRIKPELMNKVDGEVTFTMNPEKVQCSNLSPEIEAWITADLLGLQIDGKQAREDVLFDLEYMDTRAWKVTTRSVEYVQNGYSDDMRYGTSPTKYKYRIQTVIDEVLTKPQNARMGLYRRGEGYVITTDEAFLKSKKRTLNRFRFRSIMMIEKQQYFAKKVDVNNRLHHTITEFSTELLEHVTWRGQELHEVDVRNSQMAILAHVMTHGDVLGEGIAFPALKPTASTRAFLTACETGTIYDDMAPKFDLRRAQAKDEMFRVVFGGLNRSSLSWKKVAELHPQVAAWLETTKQIVVGTDENGKDIRFNVAVYMQKVEASIMIDQVYVALKQAGIVAFTKHDSYLVPASQVAKAEAIVESVFAQIGYKATLKNKTQIMETPTPPTEENWLAQLAQGTTTFQTIIQQFEAQQAVVVEEQLELFSLYGLHPYFGA